MLLVALPIDVVVDALVQARYHVVVVFVQAVSDALCGYNARSWPDGRRHSVIDVRLLVVSLCASLIATI